MDANIESHHALTRRTLLQLVVPITSGVAAPSAYLTPIKTFDRSAAWAMSPDGNTLAMTNWGRNPRALEMVDVGLDWPKRFDFAVKEGAVGTGSFFSDSGALFVDGAFGDPLRTRHLIIDFKETPKAVWWRLETQPDFGNVLYATEGRTMLLARYRRRMAFQYETLAKISVPDGTILFERPYAIATRRVNGSKDLSRISFSGDRSTFAHSFGDLIVCRRADDLNVRWTARVESPLKAHRVVFSQAAGWMAVAVADSAFVHLQSVSYISVRNGSTGEELSRIYVNGADGMAISNKGLLAVAGITAGTGGSALPTIRLYESISGKLLETQFHDKVPDGPRQWLETGFSLDGFVFTPDDKYLVSSGKQTRVWKVAAL